MPKAHALFLCFRFYVLVSLDVQSSTNLSMWILRNPLPLMWMQVHAILDLVRSAMSTRNWGNSICSLHVYKQLWVHGRIICRCWIGINLGNIFGIFRQPSFRHRYSTLLHFHSNYASVSNTEGSHRNSIITLDYWFSWTNNWIATKLEMTTHVLSPL